MMKVDLDRKELTASDEIIEIYPGIYSMPFPQKHKIELFSNYLKTTFQASFMIWNLSEHSYGND